MHFIPTTQTQLDRLKDRAKCLRGQHDRLGHARDAAAREFGYSDYHHALHCATLTAGQRSSAAGIGVHAVDLRHIELAIEHLAEFLAGDPAVDLNNAVVRTCMETFEGLRTAGQLAKVWVTKTPEAFFVGAVRDFDAFGSDDFPPTVSNKNAAQRDAARLLWSALLEPQRSSAFHLLYCYCFIKVFASYAAGMRHMRRDEPVYSVNRHLCEVMQTVMETSTASEALDYIHGPADDLMPRAMNIDIHTGKEDYAVPSTWWSRVQAGVAINMAGTCSILPFTQISEYMTKGATGKMPFIPLYSPRDTALRESYVRTAKERWQDLPP